MPGQWTATHPRARGAADRARRLRWRGRGASPDATNRRARGARSAKGGERGTRGAAPDPTKGARWGPPLRGATRSPRASRRSGSRSGAARGTRRPGPRMPPYRWRGGEPRRDRRRAAAQEAPAAARTAPFAAAGSNVKISRNATPRIPHFRIARAPRPSGSWSPTQVVPRAASARARLDLGGCRRRRCQDSPDPAGETRARCPAGFSWEKRRWVWALTSPGTRTVGSPPTTRAPRAPRAESHDSPAAEHQVSVALHDLGREDGGPAGPCKQNARGGGGGPVSRGRWVCQSSASSPRPSTKSCRFRGTTGSRRARRARRSPRIG